MNNIGTDGYSPVGNESIIIETITNLIDKRYTVCYWDDDTSRSAYVKQEVEAQFGAELNKDVFILKEMKISGQAMLHYDVSVFVNPDYNNKPVILRDCKMAAMRCNMEMYV
jgi:hypothetical protein